MFLNLDRKQNHVMRYAWDHLATEAAEASFAISLYAYGMQI